MADTTIPLFNPSDPVIQEKILIQVSTMAGLLKERVKYVAAQETNKYIESQARSIYSAYSKDVCIVGSQQLIELQMYNTILSNRLSTVSSAVSMVQEQLATTDTVSISSFSTLLMAPYMPTALQQYFPALTGSGFIVG